MPIPLRLYNTLTRNKAELVALDSRAVRMYVCGPTVYDFAHIGNARPVIVFDVLFRLLRKLYGADHVVYARNVTVLDTEMSEGMERNMTTGESYSIHGDVALTYALERFRAETGSKALESLVRELNAGFYGEKEIRQKFHSR